MSLVAVGLRFDEGGSLAGPRPIDGLAGRLGHELDLVAVDRDAGDAVGDRAPERQVEHGRGPRQRGAHRVEVVLGDVDHRQLP